MSIPTPTTKEKMSWPLVGEEKELFVDYALGHRDIQIRSRIMFSQKVEIFRSCYNSHEERKTMGLHICKEHLSKDANFLVTFPTLTSKEVAAEVKAIKQKCRETLTSSAGDEKETFALLDRINTHVIKTEVAPAFFASAMYEDYTNSLGLYQIKNMNVARTNYAPVVMLDTLFADFKMDMESASGPASHHHHGVSLGASLTWQGGRGSPSASSFDETSQSSTGDYSPTSAKEKTAGRASTGKLFRMKSKILKKSSSVDRLAETSGGSAGERDNLSSSPHSSNSLSTPEKLGLATSPTTNTATTNASGNSNNSNSNGPPWPLLPHSLSGGSVSISNSNSSGSANSSMSGSRTGLPARRKSTPHPRASSNLLLTFAQTSPSIAIADESLQQQQVLSCPKNVKVRLDDSSKQGSGDSYTTSAVAVFKERDIFLFSTYRRSPENVRMESAMFAADYARGAATTHAFVCDMSGKMYGAQSQSPQRYEDKAVLVCRKEKKFRASETKMEEYEAAD